MWTFVHVWWGRIIMVFAIINGGLGIQYAANAVPAEKGYGVVAGIFGLAYICVLVWWYMKTGKQVEQRKSEESIVVASLVQLRNAPAHVKKGAMTEVKEV
jgi:hypothetical protein